MANVVRQTLLVLVALALINHNEASAPFFLQAITSALGTIPFSAGPMTTGLVGAKLAVGTKLLYYLGFFGRRSRPKPAPVAPLRTKQGLGGQFSGGMQAVPLPYAFGAGAAGFPQQFGGFGAGGFGPGGFGGGNPNAFAQFPYGYDPAQIFQMMAAQGIDPATAMQAMAFNGGPGGQAGPASQFPGGHAASTSQFPGNQAIATSQFQSSQAVPASQFQFPTDGAPNSAGGNSHLNIPSESKSPGADSSKDEGSDNDVESFFTFLRDMDENSCISRLVCDIGANPSFLGEFSENIHGIIRSLDVLPSSGAFPYISIMETGRSGGCAQRFLQCSDAAYEIVKNVAPSVGMPQNINTEAVNQL